MPSSCLGIAEAPRSAFQFSAAPEIVRIEKRDPFSSGFFGSAVPSRTLAQIVLMNIADLNSRPRLTLDQRGNDFLRVIGRSVVDNNHLEVPVGLRQNAAERRMNLSPQLKVGMITDMKDTCSLHGISDPSFAFRHRGTASRSSSFQGAIVPSNLMLHLSSHHREQAESVGGKTCDRPMVMLVAGLAAKPIMRKP